MTLKIAIVGCGKIADGHVGEIQKMSGAEVVAVCDLELLMAEQLARRFSIPAYYDDLDELLEKERPDVVHITTPPQVHLALARRAMDAGAHVYVEKPLTMSLAETEALLEHATRTGRKVTVGHSFFFDPPALALRRMVEAGVVGEPVHVESWFGYNLSGPFGAAMLADSTHWVHALPGRLFHNNIDHMLNKVLEFVPDPHPRVEARAFTRRPERFGDVRDRLQDELRVGIFGETTTGAGTFSSHAQPVSHFMRLYGTRNIVHVDFNIRSVTIENGVKLPSAIGRLLPPFGRGWSYNREGWKNVYRFSRSRFQFFAGMHHLIDRFYDAVRNDAPLPIPYEEMRRMSAVLDEIFRQINAGEESS